MPARFKLGYVAASGNRQQPVMIHRAILGSIERFIGILLEDTEGRLPVWLAPIQAVIMNITDQHAAYASEVEKALKKQGVRAETDLRNEKIGYKIRHHTLRRIPYLLVVGGREVADHTIAVRTREGRDLGAIPLGEFAGMIESLTSNHGIGNTGGIKDSVS